MDSLSSEQDPHNNSVLFGGNSVVCVNSEMTSLDSGVDTGNDSNDSSVAQHENFVGGQINNVENNILACICRKGVPFRSSENGEMTFVDSRGDSGSNSNNTFQQESLAGGQINNIAIAVATTSGNNQGEMQQNEQNTFRIEFSPVWPLDLKNLPIPSLYPILENYNHEHGHGSAATNKRALRSYSHRALRRATREQDYASAFCHRKMKFIQRPLREYEMRLAAATNNTGLMRKLLESGVSPNIHDEKKRTPLHLAAYRGYTEIVQMLLEYGADPNRRDCIGNTPLHLAAVTCKVEVVTLLLKAGTDVLSLDQRGYSPLQLAQAKLRLLQNCLADDMFKIKKEVHNVVNMLLAYLQKQKDTCEQVETLTAFCSRLSLSNTSDQIQDDVKDLLANIDALSITS